MLLVVAAASEGDTCTTNWPEQRVDAVGDEYALVGAQAGHLAAGGDHLGRGERLDRDALRDRVLKVIGAVGRVGVHPEAEVGCVAIAHRAAPGHHRGLARGELEGLLGVRRFVEADRAAHLEAGRDVEIEGGVVVDDRLRVRLVARGEEARQHGAEQQRLRDREGGRRAARQGVAGDGGRGQAPGGQVVGQRHGYGGRAVLPCGDVGLPEGGVLEVGAHFLGRGRS